MLHVPRRSTRWLVLLAAAAAVSLVVWGCSKNPLRTDGDVSAVDPASTFSTANPRVQAVMRLQERNTPQLMSIDGVVGTATGLDANGKVVVQVLTERPMGLRLPQTLGGVGVVEIVTGKIIAYKGPGGGVSHTALQTPPIQLGTSGGPLEIANGFCCGGTLGSLVHIGNTQYILSNSHVFAGDVVPGGNGTVSAIGDDITQPSIIETGCNQAGTQVVADLSSLSTLYPPGTTPNVDCAIAQVRAGMVSTDGAILEIGTLSASTVGASVGQAVKKSGRTTGLSRSKVNGINATVNVGYSDECAGGSFTKTFTGQILIANRGSKFLNSGDSGSLMVEDVTTNPRAVGLLYAGGGSTAVANPINDVLSHLGASMVGN